MVPVRQLDLLYFNAAAMLSRLSRCCLIGWLALFTHLSAPAKALQRGCPLQLRHTEVKHLDSGYEPSTKRSDCWLKLKKAARRNGNCTTCDYGREQFGLSCHQAV